MAPGQQVFDDLFGELAAGHQQAQNLGVGKSDKLAVSASLGAGSGR